MKKFMMIAALLATFASPAIAADGNNANPIVRTQVVSYSDLNLGTKQGATELKHRIRTAVQDLCGVASPSDLQGTNRMKQCHRESKKAVAAEVATAIAAARTPVRIADSR